MSKPFRVLSIDGGGIRGIIPATVLAELELETGHQTAELFDLIAGTSTGGILALGLTAPAADGSRKPAWRAGDLVDLYEREGRNIFHSDVLHDVVSAGGLLDERYPAAGLEKALGRYLGDAMLTEAVTDVLITAYDIENRRPFFFKSHRATGEQGWDYPMRVVARATSAAPTYFEPARVTAGDGRTGFTLVDGGVFANNPAMCAYAEARRDGAQDVVIVSLGTGQLTRRLPYKDVKGWGLIEWARPILDVVFDGVSDAIDYQLDQLLGPDRHVRLQVDLDRGAKDALDDASPRNIGLLKERAAELVAHERERLARVGAELLTG